MVEPMKPFLVTGCCNPHHGPWPVPEAMTPMNGMIKELMIIAVYLGWSLIWLSINDHWSSLEYWSSLFICHQYSRVVSKEWSSPLTFLLTKLQSIRIKQLHQRFSALCDFPPPGQLPLKALCCASICARLMLLKPSKNASTPPIWATVWGNPLRCETSAGLTGLQLKELAVIANPLKNMVCFHLMIITRVFSF